MTSYAGPPRGPGPSHVQAAAGRAARSRGAAGARSARLRSPGDDRDQRVEQHADAAAAGVDDPGPAQHLELLGGAGQRGRAPRPPPRVRPSARSRRRRRAAAAAAVGGLAQRP